MKRARGTTHGCRPELRAGLVAFALASAAAVPLVGPAGAEASPFAKLVMPGPVIEGHARWEEDCEQCHDPFRKEDQYQRCLQCHEEVAADLDAGTGHHGRRVDHEHENCRDCHVEHKGRDAEITWLDPENFDHDLTDFPLKGSHRDTACLGCHKPGSRHRDAASACVDCHRRDDVHAGRLGNGCNDCHGLRSWKRSRFDHETTGFSLLGAHSTTDCSACHVDRLFENTPTTCVGCHRQDDNHGGSRGDDCARCHDNSAWKTSVFDHEGETGFALSGSHVQLACLDCHPAGDLEAEQPRECLGCHASDDVHRGSRGEACTDCHGEEDWLDSTFDHDRQTEFPLRGSHQQLACESCHSESVYQAGPGSHCVDCHGQRDPHEGTLGKDCDACHAEEEWTDEVIFDHDFARFALLGLHTAVACERCHASRRFELAPLLCSDCHAQNDAHDGLLGTACQDCHNPNGWQSWLFDHADTGFGLEGAHVDLPCQSCHLQAVDEAAPPRRCYGCHDDDDIHRGKLGLGCERCHGTDSFSGTRLNQRRDGRSFALAAGVSTPDRWQE